MGKKIEVDLNVIDAGKAHWLAPHRRWPHIAKAVAEKYRKLRNAQRAMDRVAKKMDQMEQRVKDRTK